jgi:hypothetical protein
MALNLINRGSVANDGTGDNLRAGAEKVNSNFTEIYTALGNGTVINGTIKIHDDSSTETIVSANGEVFKILGGTGITSTISGNDLTLAVDGTIITGSSSTTLTNKTINGPDNTITNLDNANLSSSAGILNAQLANSAITVSDGSNSTARALGSTLTISGTTNEVEVVESSGTVTVGLPNDVIIAGNLTVQGTQTKVDSTTIEVTNSFTFEGTTSDDHETVLTVENPTADRTVTIPNATGTIVLKDSTDTLTNKTINGPDNTITNIANSSLANNSVTLGATSVALGATAASASNFNLSGTSSISGTGTIDLTSTTNKIRFAYANTGSLPTASTYEGMFAYDVGGNNAYVADTGGWVKIITENSSIADISNVGSIASITDQQALVWNAGAGRFDPASIPTSGFAIAMAVAL